MGLAEDASLNGSCQHKMKIIKKKYKGNCTWWRHFYNRGKWCLLKRIEKEDCVHRIFQNPFKTVPRCYSEILAQWWILLI